MASSFSGSSPEGSPATSRESSVRASAGSEAQDSGLAYFSTSRRRGAHHEVVEIHRRDLALQDNGEGPANGAVCFRFVVGAPRLLDLTRFGFRVLMVQRGNQLQA